MFPFDPYGVSKVNIGLEMVKKFMKKNLEKLVLSFKFIG